MSVNDCSSSSSTVRILYQTVQLSIKQVDSFMKLNMKSTGEERRLTNRNFKDRDVGNLCGRYNLKLSCEDILLIATPLKG
ncbi:hypothetical protein L1987_28723 [Smallanthus sonchifolius]|uniref:Uncharacterized protein n=1 Tax=Smallanthus sonchifolius TaxID=185202 RepID=A0ACB9HZT7_9ASTR|nr:hypothetical protein L1987_28723 [Smallanthus sonchifolius]